MATLSFAATHPAPVNLQAWCDEHAASFVPPVCNKTMTNRGAYFKIQMVGGPNTRTDYHVEDGEEFFYMLKGDMCLKVVDGGRFRDIPIREGECFLLPGRVPHSPQRLANTMGLVIERDRNASEIDALRWYCPKCRRLQHQDTFHCVDLGSQLAPVIRQYYSTEALRTCTACGTVDLPALQNPDYGVAAEPAQYDAAQRQAEVDQFMKVLSPAERVEHAGKLPFINPVSHPAPRPLRQWLALQRARAAGDNGAASAVTSLFGGDRCEFQVSVQSGPVSLPAEFTTHPTERWFYQLDGPLTLHVQDDGRDHALVLEAGDVFLLPARVPHRCARPAGSDGLVVEARQPSQQ